MMFKKKCPVCGAKNSKERTACIECGAPLASEQVKGQLSRVSTEAEAQVKTMKCAFHPERDAAGVCVDCNRMVCEHCRDIFDGKYYCHQCAEQVFGRPPAVPPKPPVVAAKPVKARFNRIINIFWKVYFYLFAIIIIIYYSTEGLNDIDEIGDLVFSIPSLIAVFLYAYKKRLFGARFWKIYFLIFVTYEVYRNVEPIIGGEEVAADWWIGFIIFIPLYVALYLYAFKFLKEGTVDTHMTLK